jgi:hypothetical protein
LAALIAAGPACSSGENSKGENPADEAPGALTRAVDEPAAEQPAQPITEQPAAGDPARPITEKPAEPAPEEPVATPPPEPAPESSEPEPSAPPETSVKVTVPDGPVRVAAPKPGLTYVGVEKCQTCHKVQVTSWLETKHATLTPPLDCESCHGPGSEYRALKIMKDPEAARAAGLVDPAAEFCATCHVGGWTDDMLKKAHAHKETPE